MKTYDHYLIPEWPVNSNVHAAVTTRQFGDLAKPAQQPSTLKRLQSELNLPNDPFWLEQVHGTHVINLDQSSMKNVGDASYVSSPTATCVVLTADCLPIFIASRNGKEIAAVHAGWKGLVAGVIDQTLLHFKSVTQDLIVWLGPAIGPDHFEVGPEVREQFISRHPQYAEGFYIRNGSWYGDLYHLAKINLKHCEVTAIYGGGFCTYCDSNRFYSFRREKTAAGRMASLIWITNGNYDKIGNTAIR